MLYEYPVSVSSCDYPMSVSQYHVSVCQCTVSVSVYLTCVRVQAMGSGRARTSPTFFQGLFRRLTGPDS